MLNHARCDLFTCLQSGEVGKYLALHVHLASQQPVQQPVDGGPACNPLRTEIRKHCTQTCIATGQALAQIGSSPEPVVQADKLKALS